MFYNEPQAMSKVHIERAGKPRKSKYESQANYENRLEMWDASQPCEVDIKPKGNSMTTKYYAEH